MGLQVLVVEVVFELMKVMFLLSINSFQPGDGPGDVITSSSYSPYDAFKGSAST